MKPDSPDSDAKSSASRVGNSFYDFESDDPKRSGAHGQEADFDELEGDSSAEEGYNNYRKSGRKARYGAGESGGQTVIVKPSRGRGRPPLSANQTKAEEDDGTSN